MTNTVFKSQLELRGAKREYLALTLVGLFTLGFIITILRNPEPFLHPSFSSEDAVWTGNLLTNGLLNTLFTARTDYFVVANILLLYSGIVINKLFFGLSILNLSIIQSILADGFFSMVGVGGYFFIKTMGKNSRLGILFFCFIIFLPFDNSNDNILGRCFNAGYFFPFICVMSLVLRERFLQSKIRTLFFNLVVLLSCATNPICYAIVILYLLINFKVNKSLLFSMLAILLLNIITYFFRHGSMQQSIPQPIKSNEFIEFIFARSAFYSLFSQIYHYLNNCVSLIIFFFIFILVLFLVRKTKDRIILFLSGSYLIVSLSIFIMRPGLSFYLNDYKSSFPEWYFMGQNLLFALLIFYLVSKIKNFVIYLLCVIILSFGVFGHIDKRFNTYNLADLPDNKLQSLICTSGAINGIYLVSAFPAGWIMSMPSKYIKATCKEYRLAPSLNKLNVAIDKKYTINGYIDLIKYMDNKHILLNGWAYLVDQDANLATPYLILTNQKSNLPYYYLLTKSLRRDVGDAFSDSNLNMSGFSNDFDISNLPFGEYDISIYIRGIDGYGAIKQFQPIEIK